MTEPQETGSDREILGENDPEAYDKAADRVTADADRGVWVVEENRGNGWSVSAVLTSHEDARAYVQDARDFVENCPEDAPESFSRSTIRFRYGGRSSPKKLFESWPPQGGESDAE